MFKLKSRPKVFDGKEFDRLFEISKFANFTAEEFDSYKNAEKMIWDYYNTIDTAVEEGERRGLEKGRAEGERSKANEIAAKLIANGMSKEEAAEIVGLSESYRT